MVNDVVSVLRGHVIQHKLAAMYLEKNNIDSFH